MGRKASGDFKDESERRKAGRWTEERGRVGGWNEE